MAADVAIQTAAIWFVYAAPMIWTLCQQEKSFDGKLAKPGPEFANREWTGFSKDRWTSWGVQLRHIAGRSERESKTSKLVNDALAAMKTVG